MSAVTSRAYAPYCWGLPVAGLASVAALVAVAGLRVDLEFALVVLAGLLSAALSAAAAAAVFRFGAPALGLPTDPREPRWFFGAAAAAGALFVVNIGLAVAAISLKYREPPLRVWRANLRPLVALDILGSLALIGFVGLMAGVEEVSLRVV